MQSVQNEKGNHKTVTRLRINWSRKEKKRKATVLYDQGNEQDWMMKVRRRTKLVENYKLVVMNII